MFKNKVENVLCPRKKVDKPICLIIIDEKNDFLKFVGWENGWMFVIQFKGLLTGMKICFPILKVHTHEVVASKNICARGIHHPYLNAGVNFNVLFDLSRKLP